MARFTVEWDPDFEQEFTDFWLQSTSELRQVLTNACNIADRALANAADQLGEAIPLEPGLHCWIVSNLPKRVAVYYYVSVPDRRVRVVRLSVQL